jgi:hypothetical protein
MNKTHLLIFAGAAVAGYFLAANVVGYQPFTWAFTQGATLGTKTA